MVAGFARHITEFPCQSDPRGRTFHATDHLKYKVQSTDLGRHLLMLLMLLVVLLVVFLVVAVAAVAAATTTTVTVM
jgi:hypothetical protein